MSVSRNSTLRYVCGVAATASLALALAGNVQAGVHTFTFTLDGSREIPSNNSPGTGTAIVTLDDITGAVTVTGDYVNMTSNVNNAHIHGPADQCTGNVPVVQLAFTGGTSGTFSGTGTLTPAQVQDMLDEKHYINVHTVMFGPGEIRGQVTNGIPFCNDCDGALALCPCNAGDPDSGCELPQGTGGVRLRVTSYAPDGAGGGTATFTGTSFPAMGNPTVVLLRAPNAEDPPVVFGDGLRCVGATATRITSVFAAGGTSTSNVWHGAGAGTFHYQLWFRSQPASFCDAAAAFNLSNGVSLTWP